jgi:hypothetical protein
MAIQNLELPSSRLLTSSLRPIPKFGILYVQQIVCQKKLRLVEYNLLKINWMHECVRAPERRNRSPIPKTVLKQCDVSKDCMPDWRD